MTAHDEAITFIRAAQEIGGDIKVSHLRAAARSGKLVAWKIGGRLFTTRKDCQEWLLECRVKATKREAAKPFVDKRQMQMFAGPPLCDCERSTDGIAKAILVCNCKPNRWANAA